MVGFDPAPTEPALRHLRRSLLRRTCGRGRARRAEIPAASQKALSERYWGVEGVIAEEVDDPGHVPDGRFAAALFPIDYRELGDTELGRYVFLEEA